MEIKNLLEELYKSKQNNEIYSITDKNYCSSCNSIDIIESEGYSVCRTCGIRNDCVLDQGQEWRYYAGDDNNKSKDPSRCGMPANELLPNTSIGVIISNSNKETYDMKKIRNLQYWSNISYKESNLIKIFNNITIITQNGGISGCITEEAKIMYMKVSALKTNRRLKKDCMKAASVTLACKFLNVPRSIDEICIMFNITNKQLFHKALKSFEEIWFSIEYRDKNEKMDNIKKYLKDNPIKELSLSEWKNICENMDNYDINDIITVQTKLQDIKKYKTIHTPIINDINDININQSIQDKKIQLTSYNNNNYLHRLCCNLGIGDNIYKICQEICNIIEINKILSKHNPVSRITSVIYYVIIKYNIAITKQTISSVCNVSEVTINKCYSKLIKYFDQNLGQE